MFTVIGPARVGIDPLNQYVLQDKLGRSIWSAVIYSGRQLLADLSWQEDLRALEIRVQSGQPRAGNLGRSIRPNLASRAHAGLKLLLSILCTGAQNPTNAARLSHDTTPRPPPM